MNDEPQNSASPTPTPTPASPKPSLTVPEGSIRETLESIVIAFVLAFVFRAFVVEAFVIPTGSMAPTLLGAHVTVTCPQCGYTFTASPRDYASTNPSNGQRTPTSVQGLPNPGGPLELRCPQCGYPIHIDHTRTNAGDRILVLKYIYAFREPRRWEVVVFKYPGDPTENYIKRLVGLPGEQLWIVNGNVYTRKLVDGAPPPDSTPWQIQRKPDQVQRAVWQPVYHSDYIPLDDGKVSNDLGGRREAWRIPWQPIDASASAWSFDRHGPKWTYHGAADAKAPGVMAFQFNPQTYYINYYPYNTLMGLGGAEGHNLIADMRLAATLIPKGPGLCTTLHMTAADLEIRAVIDADGKLQLQTRPRPDKDISAERTDDNAKPWTTRATAKLDAFVAGRPVRLELWHVDQAVSVWLDGRKVASWDYDVDVPEMAHRQRATHAPVVMLSVQGADTIVRSLDLDRDLYYTQQRAGSLGTHDRPATIHADRFFCLGDNSPESSDSRLWQFNDPPLNPWVAFYTQTEHEREHPGEFYGFVPRDMMIGRAFFVYFPAPYRLSTDSLGFIPNFGHMRFIH